MPSTLENTSESIGNVECVNPGRPVYFSYARNSSKKTEWEHISDCVDTILKQLTEHNIEYRLDKRDLGAGDRVSDFEKEIGWNSEVVVLIFSDKYFRSMHCMYELVQIKNALKKYPNKRLFCIKSGNFNLADSNYVYELERFWGFSTLNYSHASNKDWSSFIADIEKYYIDTPKSLFADELKRQSLIRKLQFFGLGFVTLAVIIGFVLFLFRSNINKITQDSGIEVLFPEYVRNVYFDNGFAYIKAIRIDEDHTVVDFHAVNTTDDTLKKVPANSPSIHILSDGKQYNLIKAYSIPDGVNNLESSNLENVPEYFPGGKGTVVDFSLEFASIPTESETIDFVEQDSLGVFGVKLQRKTLKEGLSHPVADANQTIVVHDIEFNKDETVLFCRFNNSTGDDIALSASCSKCYIMMDGVKYQLKNASGIPLSPKTINIATNTKTDFALFSPPIERRNTNIDFVFNSQLIINAIKL